MRQFVYDGREWESVEQCYQAMKFPDTAIQDAGHMGGNISRMLLYQEKLRAIKKKPGEARTQYQQLQRVAAPCESPKLRLSLQKVRGMGWGQEKDSKHGMDVWNEGQRYKTLRKDWDAVKALRFDTRLSPA